MMSLLLNTGEDGMLLLLGAPVARHSAKSSVQQTASHSRTNITQKWCDTRDAWMLNFKEFEPGPPKSRTLGTLADTKGSYGCSALMNNWSEALQQGPQQQNSLLQISGPYAVSLLQD